MGLSEPQLEAIGFKLRKGDIFHTLSVGNYRLYIIPAQQFLQIFKKDSKVLESDTLNDLELHKKQLVRSVSEITTQINKLPG